MVCGHAVFSAATAAMLAEALLPAHASSSATSATSATSTTSTSPAEALQLLQGVTHGEADGLLVCDRGVGYLCAETASRSLTPQVCEEEEGGGGRGGGRVREGEGEGEVGRAREVGRRSLASEVCGGRGGAGGWGKKGGQERFVKPLQRGVGKLGSVACESGAVVAGAGERGGGGARAGGVYSHVLTTTHN